MIQDSRPYTEFKQKTFSGYKKRDVMNSLIRSIQSKQIEASCYWLLEAVLSGYVVETWENLLYYYSQTIHKNNSKLLAILFEKHKLMKQFTDSLSKKELLELRNNQVVLHLLITVIVLFIQTKLDCQFKEPKLKSQDFQAELLPFKLNSDMSLLPDAIVNFGEPPELKMIANEIFYHCKKQSTEKVIYWMSWLLEWERLNIKNKIQWTLKPRTANVRDKYKQDIVWIFWDIIYSQINAKSKYKQSVDQLYFLFCDSFDKTKRKRKLVFLWNAVYLITNTKKLPLLEVDYTLLIQAQCNYHKLLLSKKVNEVHKETPLVKSNKPSKKKKPILKVEEEKSQQKLNDFNEIDRLLFL